MSSAANPVIDVKQRRSVVVTIASTAHMIVGLSSFGLAIFLLYLTRSPEILKEPDAADAIRGLKMGALVMAAGGVPFVVGAIGLWKGRIWGWGISVVTDVAGATALLWDSFAERKIDWDDVGLGGVFVVLLGLALLPGVWRWCRRRRTGNGKRVTGTR